MKKTPLYKDFKSTLENLKPDIIFSHGCQYRDAAKVALYIKNNPSVKLFVDNHADFTDSATNFLSKNVLHKIIWRHYAHYMLPYTEKFWRVLPARVDFLIDVYKLPKDKCDLLVMGADDELVELANNNIVHSRIRDKFGVLEDDFLIVTGGKIDRAKMQTCLLMQAVKEISNPKVKVIVFGSIEESIKDDVLKWVDDVKVIYAGWITPDNSFDYFAASDLVVFPGRHSVFWEQVVGQGKPMVCRSWPGTHHIDVGGNVQFLESDSMVEIKKCVEDLINTPELYEKMKVNAIQIGKTMFSYRRIAEKCIGEHQ